MKQNTTITTRDRIVAVVAWLGNRAHRRVLATLLVIGINHFVGAEYQITDVSLMLDLVIGAISAAWSPHTPPVEPIAELDVDQGEAS